MVSCGTPVKIWTTAVVMASLCWTGTADQQKLVSCCKQVTHVEFADPITGYRFQMYQAPCVNAVIFETEKGQICSHHKQLWVRKKIKEFRNSKSPTFSSSTKSMTSPFTTSTTLPSTTPSPSSTTPPHSSSPPSLSSSPPSISSSPSVFSSILSLLSSLLPAPRDSDTTHSSRPPISSSHSYLLSSLLPATSSPPPLSTSPHEDPTKDASTQRSKSSQ